MLEVYNAFTDHNLTDNNFVSDEDTFRGKALGRITKEGKNRQSSSRKRKER